MKYGYGSGIAISTFALQYGSFNHGIVIHRLTDITKYWLITISESGLLTVSNSSTDSEVPNIVIVAIG